MKRKDNFEKWNTFKKHEKFSFSVKCMRNAWDQRTMVDAHTWALYSVKLPTLLKFKQQIVYRIYIYMYMNKLIQNRGLCVSRKQKTNGAVEQFK